jgi:hypothetical protein
MKIDKQTLSTLFHTYFGHLLVIGLMIGGYIYNVKFIQLGIPYLGETKCLLSQATVGGLMALLAVITAVVALVWGFHLGKLKWDLYRKIDVIILVGFVQMCLTIWAPSITTEAALATWMVCTSVVLGIGIPLTFPLIYELIPTKQRGMVAGLIAGLGYLAMNLSPAVWTVESLMLESMVFMAPGVGIFLIFRLFGWLKKWIPVPTDYTKYEGRFTSRPIIGVLVLMFIVFFVDSLGFLRVIAPASNIVNLTWQGPFESRFIIGVVHCIAGIGAGYLYSKTDEWTVGLLSLGIFVIADVLFSLYSPAMSSVQLVSIASLYCIAVSAYTVNNFAIWVDVSTRDNLSKNAALGIGIGGWLSSFISTYSAYQLAASVPFATHLAIPAIISGAALLIISLILKNKRGILLGVEPAKV